jgi:predicted Zn finger-like uncharacterized protein
MPLQISCPHCNTRHNLDDALAGKTVRCKECKQPFAVDGDERERRPATPSAQAVREQSPAPARPGPRRDDREEDHNRPGRRYRDDEDDRDDRSRRRRRDEDDRGYAPPPKKKGSLLLILLMSIGGGLLLIGGGIYLLIFLLIPNQVDQKLEDLKAEDAEQRSQALIWLSEAEPREDKRAKVTSTLEKLMESGGPGLNPDLLFRAYLRWLDKDNLSALVGLLEKPAISSRIRSLALSTLAATTPQADQRAKVLATLENLVQGGGGDLDHDALVRAYLRWVDKDNVPALIAILDRPALPIWIPGRVGMLLEALGKMQDERAIEPIARKLPDLFVHEQAANALRLMGAKAEKAVIKYAFHNDPGTRQRALQLLEGYGVTHDKIADEAVSRLQSIQPDVRRAALSWFVDNPPNDDKKKSTASTALAKQLEDLDQQVREQALRALKLWATKDCLPQLAAYAKREEKAPFGNEMLIDVLAQFKDETAAEAIALQLLNFHMRVRGKPTQALVNMGPLAAKAVLKYINHPDQGVRDEAKKIYGLLKIPAPTVGQIDQILGDIAEGDKEQKRTALQQLAALKVNEASREKVSKALNAALLDGDKEVVEDAVKAAKVWGTKANLEALIKVLGPAQIQGLGRNEHVIAALASIKDPKAAKAIADGLCNFHERDKAGKALIAIGPEAEEATLAFVIRAPDSATRIAACNVVGEIGTVKSMKVLDAVGKKLRNRDNNFYQAAVIAFAKIKERQTTEKK